MKSGMSSFDIAAMVKELQTLIGARIDKTYQLSRDKLLIRLRVPEQGRKDLVIIVGKWLYLTSKSQETPKTPTSFAMLLRKHLSNGTITKIEQHGFDRIVKIHIQKAESFQLVCEMFREGNVVLVSDGKIIQPLISKSWSQREVRAKRDYVFPPPRYDFIALDRKSFEDILKNSKKDLVRTLAGDVNLGGVYAEEICQITEIPKNKKAKELSVDEIELIFDAMKNLLTSLKEVKGGMLVSADSNIVDVIPFPLNKYEENEKENFDVFSEAVEKYLENFVEEEPVDIDYENAKSRLERQKAQQEKAILNQEKKAERDKKTAELIYGHYQDCEGILSSVKSGFESKTLPDLIPKLEEQSIYKQLNPAKSEIVLELEDENENKFEVILNFKKSIEENAGIYYDKAKKAKEKLEGAKNSLKDTEVKLSKIEVEKEVKKKKRKRGTKKFWFEKYRWFISSDGNIVIAGRDARTNDKVVKKYLADKDRYAHAEIHGAPSVVIKHQNEEILERTLQEACEFALNFSKAWNAKIGAGNAYWVLPDQVSKTAPAGEFVPRGAFIIRGKRNYTQKIEMRLGVGLITYEGTEKVMCAPVSAIENQCSRYVIFEPGDMKKSDFVRKLCKTFDLEKEEVAGILPPGNVKVVSSVGLADDAF
jgi:predicted ribosome quality control (RQC) complex YloA/Tae2 family protein